MESRKFKTIKEVPSTIGGLEDFETVPEGIICKAHIWHGVSTIEYKEKKICDVDSRMAKDYFEEVNQ